MDSAKDVVIIVSSVPTLSVPSASPLFTKPPELTARPAQTPARPVLKVVSSTNVPAARLGLFWILLPRLALLVMPTVLSVQVRVSAPNVPLLDFICFKASVRPARMIAQSAVLKLESTNVTLARTRQPSLETVSVFLVDQTVLLANLQLPARPV